MCLVQSLVKESTSTYLCIDLDMYLELYCKAVVLVFRSVLLFEYPGSYLLIFCHSFLLHIKSELLMRVKSYTVVLCTTTS